MNKGFLSQQRNNGFLHILVLLDNPLRLAVAIIDNETSFRQLLSYPALPASYTSCDANCLHRYLAPVLNRLELKIDKRLHIGRHELVYNYNRHAHGYYHQP